MPADATVDRYREAFMALLPPGDIARETDSDVAAFAEGATLELAAVDELVTMLEQSRAPVRAPGFLDRWEGLYALPDPYAPTLPSTPTDRRAAIVGKVTAAGDHRRATWDAAAALQGLAIGTVTRFETFEAGRSRAGDPVRSDPWRYYLTVAVGPIGSSGLADAAAVARFKGVVERDLKRAHTLVTILADVGGGPVGEGVIDLLNNRVFDGSGNRVVP